MTSPSDLTVEQIVQRAAEFIATSQAGPVDPYFPDYVVHYLDARRPPADIQVIREHLLSGNAWASWLRSATVVDAMRLLHGDPPAQNEPLNQPPGRTL